jgi:hypothetical protein
MELSEKEKYLWELVKGNGVAISRKQLLKELTPGLSTIMGAAMSKAFYTVHWAWGPDSKAPHIVKVETYNSDLSELAAVTHVEADDEMAAYVAFEKNWHDKSDNTVKIWIRKNGTV